MFADLNTWLTTNAALAQQALGLVAIFMLIIFAFGVAYFVAARSLAGVWPELSIPLQGGWVKSTALVWFVGMSAFGGLWLMITAARGAGAFTGL